MTRKREIIRFYSFREEHKKICSQFTLILIFSWILNKLSNHSKFKYFNWRIHYYSLLHIQYNFFIEKLISNRNISFILCWKSAVFENKEIKYLISLLIMYTANLRYSPGSKYCGTMLKPLFYGAGAELRLDLYSALYCRLFELNPY